MTVDMNLTNENVILYAAHWYSNQGCVSLAEFKDDLLKIKYIKRLLRRYQTRGILKERLLLNHLIALSNVFPPLPLTRLLFFKLDPQYYASLVTLTDFLSLTPQTVTGIRGQTILVSTLPRDLNLKKRLAAI